MKKTLTQTQALYLLQQLKKQQEPEGGMLFFDAIVQCNLDGSDESLERLDDFFAQMRAKGLNLKKALILPEHKNFFISIGVYIGSYIGNKISETPQWYSYDDFPQFANTTDVSKSFPFSLIAQYTCGVCLPFGAIMNALLSDFSIKDYAHKTIKEILSKSQINLLAPASDICSLFLKKIRTGKLIDNTMAYRNLLTNVKFDYSYNSLEEIDEVLKTIKNSEISSISASSRADYYGEFVNDPARQSFIYLLASYIGATSSLLAETTPKWFDYKAIKKLMGDSPYEFSLENNFVIVFDGGYRRSPVLAVTNYLFDINPNSSVGAVGFAKNVLKDNSSNLCSYPLSTKAGVNLPKDWLQVAAISGQLANMNMAHAFDSVESVAPITIEHYEKSNKTIFMSHNDVKSEALLKQIQIPPEGEVAPYNILSYDSFLNLPTGRTDAIAIKIKVFSKPTLTLEFYIPYRTSKHPLGFGIFPLIHKQNNFDESKEVLTSFVSFFYKNAMKSFEPSMGLDYWTNYYIEKHDLFEVPAWAKRDITGFDPNNSEIEIFTNY